MSDELAESERAVLDATARLEAAEAKAAEARVLAARLRALRRRGIAHLFVEAVRGART